MEELFGWLMTHVFIAAVVAGAATLVICFLLNLFVMPFTSIKGVKKAEKEGRCVEAILVEIVFPRGLQNDESGVHTSTDGIYKYEYKGKTYRYRGHYISTPPTQEKLYFRRNPKKARPSVKYGRLESEWKVIFITLMVLALVVTFFCF